MGLDIEPIEPPQLKIPTKEEMYTLSVDELRKIWSANNFALLQVIEEAGNHIPFFALHGTRNGFIEKIEREKQSNTNGGRFDTCTFLQKHGNPWDMLGDLYMTIRGIIGYTRPLGYGFNSDATTTSQDGAIIVINTEKDGKNWAKPVTHESFDKQIIEDKIFPFYYEYEDVDYQGMREGTYIRSEIPDNCRVLDSQEEKAMLRRLKAMKATKIPVTAAVKSKITLTPDTWDELVEGIIYENDIRRDLMESKMGSPDYTPLESYQEGVIGRIVVQDMLDKIFKILGVY